MRQTRTLAYAAQKSLKTVKSLEMSKIPRFIYCTNCLYILRLHFKDDKPCAGSALFAVLYKAPFNMVLLVC